MYYIYDNDNKKWIDFCFVSIELATKTMSEMIKEKAKFGIVADLTLYKKII